MKAVGEAAAMGLFISVSNSRWLSICKYSYSKNIPIIDNTSKHRYIL